MGKALSGELLCPCDSTCVSNVTTFHEHWDIVSIYEISRQTTVF